VADDAWRDGDVLARLSAMIQAEHVQPGLMAVYAEVTVQGGQSVTVLLGMAVVGMTAVGAVVFLPASERTIRLPAESRIFLVPIETREHDITAESRVYEV